MAGRDSDLRPARLSVVIATFNGAAFIESQLSSIITQSSAVDEIIVTDDGSTDDTLALVRDVATRLGWPDERLRITHNPGPRGVAANVEHGVSLATGALIALADQDDGWHPDKVAAFRDLFAQHPDVDLAHSDARLVDEEGSSLGGSLLDALGVARRDRDAIRHGHALDVLLRRNVVTGATTVLRREVASRAGSVPSGWIHDEWFAMVAAVSGRVELIERPLIDYRQHGGNQIGAEALTLRVKLSRLGEPRGQRNARLLQRAESLVDRLTGAAWAPEHVVRLAILKVRHERRRFQLPRTRLLRVPGVLAGLVTGGYGRFGHGPTDAVRDLIQPD